MALVSYGNDSDYDELAGDSEGFARPTSSSVLSAKRNTHKYDRPESTMSCKLDPIMYEKVWKDHMDQRPTPRQRYNHSAFTELSDNSKHQRRRQKEAKKEAIDKLTGQDCMLSYSKYIPRAYRPADLPIHAEDCSGDLLKVIAFCLRNTKKTRKKGEKVSKSGNSAAEREQMPVRKTSSKQEVVASARSVPAPIKEQDAPSKSQNSVKSSRRLDSPENAVTSPPTIDTENRKRKLMVFKWGTSTSSDARPQDPVVRNRDAVDERKKEEAGLAIMSLEAELKRLAKTSRASEEYQEKQEALVASKLRFGHRHGMKYALWKEWVMLEMS
ncbi:unnamed protein product [Zymoseptoria tritici ST99CH_3D7]|uniref:Uncharacterized protein n=1 Tax=Zymoseptoria tritici (strain ST99CH_3D7) TaxID=1276538 RepID=A0A1X7S6R7_ZYMT9|nr:unnamed protein product [Zymoseptoria tritici ST99CH_3D7]